MRKFTKIDDNNNEIIKFIIVNIYNANVSLEVKAFKIDN
jgi:hypothetical protein